MPVFFSKLSRCLTADSPSPREDNTALVGRKVEALVEGRKKGRWQGRSRSGTLVFFSGGEHLTGSLVDVKIENAGPWSLQGSLIE